MKISHLPAVTVFFTLFIAVNYSLYAEPVNINQATASQLESALKGIGKYKAEAIIRYRQKHGLFKKPFDIVKVKGIGNGTFLKNKKDIRIK